MNNLTLSDLDAGLQDLIASTANIKADFQKRMRAVNRVLSDLELEAYWKFNIKRKNFKYVRDVSEYQLESYLDIDDFSAPKSLAGIPIVKDDDFNPQSQSNLRVSDSLFSRGQGRGNRVYSRGSSRNFNRLSYTILDGKNYLLANLNKGNVLRIDSLDSIDSDGEWVEVGDGLNIEEDTIDYQEGNSSIKLDIDVSLSGYNFAGIKNITLSSKDLSEYFNNGIFLLRIKLPTATEVTSVTFIFGTDESNYWILTETLPLNASELQEGWQRFKFDWSDATEVGTPDASNICYFETRVNYSAALTDQESLKFDDLVLCDTFQVDFDYYSDHFVKSQAGVSQARFADLNDTFNGPRSFERVLLTLAFNQLLISSKSTRENDKQFAKQEYEDLLVKAVHEFGSTKNKGSKHIKTIL